MHPLPSLARLAPPSTHHEAVDTLVGSDGPVALRVGNRARRTEARQGGAADAAKVVIAIAGTQEPEEGGSRLGQLVS